MIEQLGRFGRSATSLAINEARWEAKTGKVQPKDSPWIASGVGQKMFISTVGRAELFRKLETGVSKRIRPQDLSGSFAIKGRGRGIKDTFCDQRAWFKITGALIPYDRDIPVGFPHCLG